MPSSRGSSQPRDGTWVSCLASPDFPDGKESTCNAGIPSLGREDPLEEEMATHFSGLDWRIPWTEEPGGLQSIGVTKSQT